jgi:hypothetical protein
MREKEMKKLLLTAAVWVLAALRLSSGGNVEPTILLLQKTFAMQNAQASLRSGFLSEKRASQNRPQPEDTLSFPAKRTYF